MSSVKVTVNTVAAMKKAKQKIAMVTAYDYTMAKIIANTDIEMILVGDSLGNVMLGYTSTIPVTMEEMIHHASAVVRGNGNAMVVCDMPFMSYQTCERDAMINAGRLLKETGCDAVKMEGGAELAPLIRKMTAAGIPVVGHIGLTPQYVNTLGGFLVQGKDKAAAQKLLDDARALEEAGVFALVLECVPDKLAALITENLENTVTIGIGAGSATDGQVLVSTDLLGMTQGRIPKFVKKFINIQELAASAFNQYASEVKTQEFPSVEQSYHMDDEILKEIR